MPYQAETAKDTPSPLPVHAHPTSVSHPHRDASAGVVLHLDALLGDTPPDFVDALCRLAAAHPQALLAFIRDPERSAVVCRELRRLIDPASESQRASS